MKPNRLTRAKLRELDPFLAGDDDEDLVDDDQVEDDRDAPMEPLYKGRPPSQKKV